MFLKKIIQYFSIIKSGKFITLFLCFLFNHIFVKYLTNLFLFQIKENESRIEELKSASTGLQDENKRLTLNLEELDTQHQLAVG